MNTLSFFLKILSVASALTGIISFILAWKGITFAHISPQYIKPAGIFLVVLSILFGAVDFVNSQPPHKYPEPSTPDTSVTLNLNTYKSNDSAEELTQILNTRAISVSESLENEKRTLLMRLENSKIKAGSKTQKTTDEIQKQLRKLDQLQETFLSLHQEHINALKEGKLTLAHEILKKIYEQLYSGDPLRGELKVQIEKTGGYSGVSVYSFPNSYPGSIPKNLSVDAARLAERFWPEFAKQDSIIMIGKSPDGW
jgi:hypothetical protein